MALSVRTHLRVGLHTSVHVFAIRLDDMHLPNIRI